MAHDLLLFVVIAVVVAVIGTAVLSLGQQLVGQMQLQLPTTPTNLMLPFTLTQLCCYCFPCHT